MQGVLGVLGLEQNHNRDLELGAHPKCQHTNISHISFSAQQLPANNIKWTGTATGHLAVLLEALIEAFLCLGPYLVGTNADNLRLCLAILSSAPNPLLFPSFLQISLVSQEPVLFARSIADNISYGLASASFESVVQAAQKANAHAFITELQDGYHTGTNSPLFAPKAFCSEGAMRR